MNGYDFPVIDLAATGENIRRIRIARGLTVRDLQSYFGFEEPRAIYKWQKGECLPTVDNLYALGRLFGVPMDQILIPAAANLQKKNGQQTYVCCSGFLNSLRLFRLRQASMQLQPFFRLLCPPPAEAGMRRGARELIIRSIKNFSGCLET